MSLRNLSSSFDERLKELDRFFEKKDRVHETMRRLVKRLDNAGITYAVVGGMAVFAQGYLRTTNDLDVLLSAAGFEEFCERFVPNDYERHEGRPRRFTDKKSEVSVDVLIAGRYPGNGKPGPIAYPDPANVVTIIEDIRVLDLPTLIQLKLAARCHQDFADVVNLIRVHNLDESYQQKLHPSLHRDYIECLEENRREEEYEAREG